MSEKRERNEQIRAAYLNREMDMNELAREHGLTKQRIYQIVHAPGQKKPSCAPVVIALIERAKAWQTPLSLASDTDVARAKDDFVATLKDAGAGEIAAALSLVDLRRR